ncbi:MAG: radical SAM protein [Nitrospiraceae bacterium]|nr:radical SAM protein [Nitrospiraceae bacterium]
MGIKRIAFIEPNTPGRHVFSKIRIPRLGALLLATIMRNRGYETRVFLEDLAPPDWSWIENSDLLCISAITNTAQRSYAIAERFRKLGMPVIMGGAHPSFLPEEALQYADYVVRQEGDEGLPELVSFLDKGNPPLAGIRGVSYKKDGRAVHNPQRPFISELLNVPSPDFSLAHGWRPGDVYPVSSSRGCPFQCRFCSVIQMFGKRYRFRSVEATLHDLKALSGISGTVFFVDDNFAANKNRTKQILRGIISEGIKMRWSAQARVDVAKDPELLRLLADAGCSKLFIGFESINPKTLELYNKKQNLEEIKSCIRALSEHGIGIHGMFVLGADTDDVETIRKTAGFARVLGRGTLQLMMLTPYPGTPIYEQFEEEGRLLHKNWLKYDGMNAVYRPALMDPEELHVETLRGLRKFYSWGYILGQVAALDFYHAALGLYGKNSVRLALRKAKKYLEDAIRGNMAAQFPSKERKLPQAQLPRTPHSVASE